MAIGPVYFPILSEEQANPGIWKAQQQAITNGQMQQNIAYMLKNQMLNQQVPYAGQMAQADLAAKQAMPAYYKAQTGEANARAGLTGDQASLLRQQTPAMVQQTQGDIYKDPILQRLWEAKQALSANGIPPALLQSIGLPGAQQQGAQQSQGIQPGMQQQQPITAQSGMPMPGGGSPYAQNVQANPLTTPNLYNGDPASNWAMFGTPLSPIQQKQIEAYGQGLNTQAKTNVTEYNKAQQGAANTADIADQTLNFIRQFQDNYDKSTYRGARWGSLPSAGAASWLVPGNLAPEQGADNASKNIAATVAKLVAGGRVTSYELQYVNDLKPNRMMAPETAHMATDFLTSKMTRLKEQQPFLNAARQQGIDPQTAGALWQMYDTQRPAYDFGQRKVNKSFQGDWRGYLNPQAVQAARTGQPYVNIPSFDNKADAQAWLKTQPQDVINAARQQIMFGGT